MLNGPEYYFAIVSAVIGSIISISLALYEYRKGVRRERSVAKEALIERLQFNDERVGQMLTQFATGTEIPNYPLDTTGLIVWLSKSNSLLSEPIITKINWHRYQLDHINAKLTAYCIFIRICGERHDKLEELKADHQSIVVHLGKVHEGIHTLIETVRKDKPEKNR